MKEAQVPSLDAARANTITRSMKGLSERQRISVALAIMLDVEHPEAVAGLRFAQMRIGEHADILMRKPVEGEAAHV